MGINTNGGLASENLSVFDYFMAHAPAEPQDWFMPVMQEDCPAVPSLNSVPPGPLCEELRSYFDDCCDVSTTAAMQWIERREELIRLQELWQAEFRKQRYVQWPAAWAALMLEHRKS